MTRKALLRAVIVLALLVTAFFAVQTMLVSLHPPAPAPVPATAEPPPASAPQASPAAAPAGEGMRTGRMALEDHGHNSVVRPPAAPEPAYYSLKRENAERVILPGVTINSAREVCVKLAGKDEQIRIKRDSGSDYQVMWQKRF